MPIPNQRVRVGGSGFTVFHWDDGTGQKVIAFAEEVAVRAVTPVAQPAVIQPLNSPQPIEIITPGAHTNGVITLTLTELYNQAVWQRLASLADSQDIVDIMRTIAAMNQAIQITKYVKPPAGVAKDPYQETFYDCVVASVTDDETINVTTMALPKQMEIWY